MKGKQSKEYITALVEKCWPMLGDDLFTDLKVALAHTLQFMPEDPPEDGQGTPVTKSQHLKDSAVRLLSSATNSGAVDATDGTVIISTGIKDAVDCIVQAAEAEFYERNEKLKKRLRELDL